MAISIPIIAEFAGDGIAKAKQEFKQLEGAGKKAQFAIKKAAIPAAAALAGLGAALFDATQGAIEDAAAQDLLANNLRKTTNATDAQIASNEEWITTQGNLLGITDDQLRPALSKLAKATGSVTTAQKLATQAMDIAAATGKPLETVVTAIEKAYGGNLAALAKLAPEYRSLIKDGATFEEVMANLAVTTGGAAQEAANTAAGKFKILGVQLAETKESIGAALIPVIEKALPVLTAFGNWASKNPTAFLAIAGAITAVSVAIIAVNAAMALNPFTAIAAGIALLVVGVVTAYNKFETFRKIVRSVVNSIAAYFEFMINGWIKATNIIIKGINLIKPGKDIPTLGSVSIGSLGGDTNDMGLAPSRIDSAMGGVFESVGSARAMSSQTNVNINVNGGDPQATVDALRRYMQLNGSVPIRTTF